MNYLTVEQISKSYGELTLFENLSFSIHKDDKIAFVAKNGSGKTSILNILSGADTPDNGQVIFRNGLRLSFLSQAPDFDEALSVEETIFSSDLPILKVIESYEKALLNLDDEDAYQRAFEAMDAQNAWEFELQFKQILFQLKLENLEQKVNTLSGGQKKRLALAKALINNPDLLILDEPTNDLDLHTVAWLEDFLMDFKNTVIVVSHDRHFLDTVCTHIADIDFGKIRLYS
uniref:ATP-binding cassette domain-containing protein n=1 Tax=Gelidibacter sp. TaxID=2018083 RepID=UPI0040490801